MDIKELNQFCSHSLIGHLQIEFIHYEEGYVSAKMPVNEKTKQPMGLLHGGASLALAETLASVGSYLMVDIEKYNVLGMHVSGDHLATIENGYIYGEAKLRRAGKTIHVWDVEIKDEQQNLVSISRVTNIIKEKEAK